MDGKDDFDGYSRIPNVKDLITLCRNLNEHLVKYVIFPVSPAERLIPVAMPACSLC